ncbi:hypothetical protein OROHE_027062 [Orobanche hederae]
MHVLLLLFWTRGKDTKRSFRKTLEGISEAWRNDRRRYD